MALKDRIPLDNHRIFMNQDHFAETHTWNGVPYVVDIGWDGNTIDKVLFVPTDSLPARAEPNTTVILDRVQMRVVDVIDAIGMKEIHLTLHEPKAV